MLRLLTGYTGDQLVLPSPDLITAPAAPKAPTPKSLDNTQEPYLGGLPCFIKPLKTKLPNDDMSYLRTKDAFTLPAEDFRNALVWSFFEYVYPFMPIVDIDQFLQSIETQDGSADKISLLLFQAVLFAGTAHVEMSFLKKAGYKTRREARRKFFQRVRVSLSQS